MSVSPRYEILVPFAKQCELEVVPQKPAPKKQRTGHSPRFTIPPKQEPECTKDSETCPETRCVHATKVIFASKKDPAA